MHTPNSTFLHSHRVKFDPLRFHQIFTFWDPLNPKIKVSQKCLCLSVCLSVYTITFERIDRLDWNLVHLFSVKKWRSSSLASHFWPTVLVLSIKNCFYKIKKSIFRTNYSRYEKMLKSKIVHLKETYKFYFNHFLEKFPVFILIKKKSLKIKSCGFRPNYERYEKIWKSKIVYLKETYKFYFDNFLIKRTIFVLIVKNVIKNQNFNFAAKQCKIQQNVRVKLFISKRPTSFVLTNFW